MERDITHDVRPETCFNTRMEQRRRPTDHLPIRPQHCTPTVLRAVLRRTPFLAPLSETDIARVAEEFQQRHYEAGTVIQRAGEMATRLAVIAAGTVKIMRPTLDGQDVVLDILAPGDFFGSLAQLGEPVYTETAIAQTDCCILAITPEQFRSLLERYPAVAIATLELVAGRLQSANRTIEQLSAHPVEQRVAATLLNLAERLGRREEDGIVIETPLSRQDLADMTGAKVETVSRIMSEFRRLDLVGGGRRWIVVRDLEGLRDMVTEAAV